MTAEQLQQNLMPCIKQCSATTTIKLPVTKQITHLFLASLEQLCTVLDILQVWLKSETVRQEACCVCVGLACYAVEVDVAQLARVLEHNITGSCEEARPIIFRHCASCVRRSSVPAADQFEHTLESFDSLQVCLAPVQQLHKVLHCRRRNSLHASARQQV